MLQDEWASLWQHGREFTHDRGVRLVDKSATNRRCTKNGAESLVMPEPALKEPAGAKASRWKAAAEHL
jgi:hypothetical protein